jgi:hypothetical protein
MPVTKDQDMKQYTGRGGHASCIPDLDDSRR